MPFYHETLQLSTKKDKEIINITKDIERIVDNSGIKNGICIIHVPHATATVIINEDEENLKEDVINLIKKLTENTWLHNTIDKNAEAHLASILLGSAKIVPIINGRLVRGPWQEVLLVELDGPRTNRKVHVVIIGEELSKHEV